MLPLNEHHQQYFEENDFIDPDVEAEPYISPIKAGNSLADDKRSYIKTLEACFNYRHSLDTMYLLSLQKPNEFLAEYDVNIIKHFARNIEMTITNILLYNKNIGIMREVQSGISPEKITETLKNKAYDSIPPAPEGHIDDLNASADGNTQIAIAAKNLKPEILDEFLRKTEPLGILQNQALSAMHSLLHKATAMLEGELGQNALHDLRRSSKEFCCDAGLIAYEAAKKLGYGSVNEIKDNNTKTMLTQALNVIREIASQKQCTAPLKELVPKYLLDFLNIAEEYRNSPDPEARELRLAYYNACNRFFVLPEALTPTKQRE